MDGICGALVLWFGLGRKGDLLSAQYGDDPPLDCWVKDREVWIVDFSYPREALEHMRSLALDLTVLDHHATAAENCAGLDYCMFDESRCGAKIAFDLMLGLGWLQENESPALVDMLGILVSYVQDRDLWTWELEHSREMSAWLASWPRTLGGWLEIVQRLTRDGFGAARSAGASILRSNSRLAEAMAAQAEEVERRQEKGPPLQVLLVNAPVLHSEVAANLLADRECDFVCAWRRVKDQYVYNLRSTTVDVSEIAKWVGGGGHKNAAGFTSPSRPARFFTYGQRVVCVHPKLSPEAEARVKSLVKVLQADHTEGPMEGESP